MNSNANAYIGTSGWNYQGFKDGFYQGVPKKNWLEFCARKFPAIETNAIPLLVSGLPSRGTDSLPITRNCWIPLTRYCLIRKGAGRNIIAITFPVCILVPFDDKINSPIENKADLSSV